MFKQPEDLNAIDVEHLTNRISKNTNLIEKIIAGNQKTEALKSDFQKKIIPFQLSNSLFYVLHLIR